MSDDTTDAKDEVLTAPGGICAPMSVHYDFPTDRHPIEYLAPLSAPRGKITYATPPTGGWGPPLTAKPLPWRIRIVRTRIVRKGRNCIGGWMVKHGHGIEGSRCHDEDCW